jgi:hypothetical protein
MTRLANRLLLDGEWDGALALLADGEGCAGRGQPSGDGTGQGDASRDSADRDSASRDSADRDSADRDSASQEEDGAGLRARILVERYWWRLDDPAPAAQAVAGLADPVLRGYLAAQLAYTRLIFNLDPRPGDEQVMRAGLEAAARDERLRGWAAFWQGTAADHVDGDPGTAGQRYAEALTRCRESGDLLLESYVVRHQGGHLIEGDPPAGEMLLRRSLHLRSALGARPQTAAAQATLAGELRPGQERDMLRQAARATATELGLTWLNKELADA